MNLKTEWLEADGLGGFASGTISGIRSRRYHALLLAATTPPSGRITLVNGFDAWIETPQGKYMLTSQHYAPDCIGGDGTQRIKQFTNEPWPTWRFVAEDGTEIQHELVAAKGSSTVVLTWKLVDGAESCRLFVRPFLSGRDYHSLHRENGGFNFDPNETFQQQVWNPYPGIPSIISSGNGVYHHDPHWYRNFLYEEERSRGLDHIEDLASPGILEFDLASDDAVWMLSTEPTSSQFEYHSCPALARAMSIRAEEKARRKSFPSPLHRAADAYLVEGGRGKTVIAGYPWFTDWGRDAFIALRGLCFATGRLDTAGEILSGWAGAVSEGMLPNRFPDQGEQPEYNSVDASLWYVVAVGEYLELRKKMASGVDETESSRLKAAVGEILQGYSAGARFNIHQDDDFLLACGQAGVQLTWMDAKVGDWVVTPRIGKPVEIQALWVNALAVGARISRKWKRHYEGSMESFRHRFWNHERGFLNDVVDVDHCRGKVDSTLRPNQVFAIGGLPVSLVDGEQARLVIEAIEDNLLTEAGLRSLGPNEPGYAGRYEGGVLQRDGAYHQGSVWPWLLGPFVEGWIRVHGGDGKARLEARRRFVEPALERARIAGGHIPEITDGDAPHFPRGCPFQAWSVAEALRLDHLTRINAPLKSKPAGRLELATT